MRFCAANYQPRWKEENAKDMRHFGKSVHRKIVRTKKGLSTDGWKDPFWKCYRHYLFMASFH